MVLLLLLVVPCVRLLGVLTGKFCENAVFGRSKQEWCGTMRWAGHVARRRWEIRKLLDFNGDSRDGECVLWTETAGRLKFLTEMGFEAGNWIKLALGESAWANYCEHEITRFMTARSFFWTSWVTVSFLTLTLLTWRIWWAPNNVRRWQMGFNSAFKGLIAVYGQGDKWSFPSRYPLCHCCTRLSWWDDLAHLILRLARDVTDKEFIWMSAADCVSLNSSGDNWVVPSRTVMIVSKL